MVLIIIHAIIAILLAFSVLVQHRASGLSSTFGGAGTTFVQRRGAEKFLFNGTIVLSILFFGLSVLRWFL